MATVSWFKARQCWRINYTLALRSKKTRRAKYAKSRSEANLMATQLERVEQATRTGMAIQHEIEDWIERGWLAENQAEVAFVGYADSSNRKQQLNPQSTDYERILESFSLYAENTSKGGRLGRNYSNNMSQARQVIAWLKAEWPNLPDLSPEGIRSHLFKMKDKYTESSIRHFLIKTHLLLDHAVKLRMIAENPAREVRLRRDLNIRVKPSKERRILTEEEARHLLDISMKYPEYLNGGLPTLVRLGLYAGLRNEEMCWLKWDCIDWDRRILSIQESVCEVTGATWVPKDYEARRIDVKEACIDFLLEEQERQLKGNNNSPFVLPAGRPGATRNEYRQKPVHPNTPSKSFARMISDEKWDESITVYSLRHTYATMALRSGVDLRTLQKRMGHADIKTTMAYLHFIEPEEHPMDKLPY